MHLLSTLASGVKGAENGTAQIYVRGTSTRATYYTDFEAGTSIATGADVSLDSNGGAEIYVNQYVDVVVKDSDGSTVREFTEGKAAPNLEYIGQSFTGVDYTTGASATRKPVNLQTILDAWLTSAGAADFEVLLEGASTTIQAALGTLYGYFFNVKSTTYGAAGDGTTDDTTAITAAVTAAAVSGGTVFFPAGTYLVSSTLSIPYNVSLIGVGAHSSIISVDHASNNLLNFTGATVGGFQTLQGLAFTAKQAHTGYICNITTNTVNLRIKECKFSGALLNNTQIYGTATGAAVHVDNCVFAPGICTNPFIEFNGDAYNVFLSVRDSKFTTVAGQTALNIIELHSGVVQNNVFDFSATTTAGTLIGVLVYKADSTPIGTVRVIGNILYGSATGGVITYLLLNDQNCGVYEHFNDIDINGDSICDTAGGNWYGQTTASRMFFGSRAGAQTSNNVTDNSATLELDSLNFEYIKLTRTNNTAQILSVGERIQAGSKFFLLIYNNSGGISGNIDFDSADFIESTGTFTIANGKVRLFSFVATYMSTTPYVKWTLISDSGDMDP